MFQGSKHIKKGEHFKFIQDRGGTLNASTSFDYTNYYEKIPANFLETALWLESDRMGFFLEALTEETLANQIDVVKNERLERYDNQPYGLMWEKLFGLLYQDVHPYHVPTIGYMKHILSFNHEDVSKFFNSYYQPANASLVIAGDVDLENVKALVEKYFGEIASPQAIEPLFIEDDQLVESKQEVVLDNVTLEKILLAWKTERIFEEKTFALDILSDILTGSKNGRLYKELVLEKELVLQVSSFQFSGRYGGFFCITATLKPGKSLDEVKKIILSEIENFFTLGCTDDELIRAKNGVKSSFVFGMQSIDSIANHLNQYNFYLKQPDAFDVELQKYQSVTPQSLLDCSPFFMSHNIDLRFIPGKKK